MTTNIFILDFRPQGGSLFAGAAQDVCRRVKQLRAEARSGHRNHIHRSLRHYAASPPDPLVVLVVPRADARRALYRILRDRQACGMGSTETPPKKNKGVSAKTRAKMREASRRAWARRRPLPAMCRSCRYRENTE